MKKKLFSQWVRLFFLLLHSHHRNLRPCVRKKWPLKWGSIIRREEEDEGGGGGGGCVGWGREVVHWKSPCYAFQIPQHHHHYHPYSSLSCSLGVLLGVLPPILLVSLVDVVKEDLPTALAVPASTKRPVMIISKKKKLSQPHLYLSWTFCFMSAMFSALISRSRYSERISVEFSRSFWLSCGGERERGGGGSERSLGWAQDKTTFSRRPYLEQFTLVVLLQVVREHVGVHEGAATLAQDVDRLPEELHLDPRHVVLLHLLHLVL